MTDGDIEALELQALGKHIDDARELLERHQRRNQDHVDARVSELMCRLNRAAVVARYLCDGTNPEGDAAREGLLDRLGYPPEGES